jgi:TonB family protein
VQIILTIGLILSAIATAQHTGETDMTTPESRLARLEGFVGLSVLVNAKGRAEAITVTRPLGLDLEAKAIDSVKAWQFVPAMKDGQPTSVTAKIDVSIRLQIYRPAEWRLSGAAFDTPAGASRPEVLAATFPPPESRPITASVTMSFDVDERGTPANIHVDKSSDPQWDTSVAEAAAQWRFKPATKDGKPVPVHATLTFMHRGGA